MKKLIHILLCLLITMLLVGCSEKPEPAQITYDELGNKTTTTAKGSDTSASTLPCAIDFNGKNVYLTKIELSQTKSDSGEYSLYTFVHFDVSALSDDEINDFRRQKLSVLISLNSPQNDMDSARTTHLGNLLYTDTKELIWIDTNSLTDLTHPYHSFMEDSWFDCSFYITVEQTAKYTYQSSNRKTYSLNKVNSLYYWVSRADSQTLFVDYDSIDPQIDNFIIERLLDHLGKMIERGF